MSIKLRYGLIGLILLAFSLRLHNFFIGSFQADEALFASWARLIAIFRDPLLQSQLVDKPPLLFYLQALFYPLLGPVDQAARFPNLIASSLFIPLSYLLAWRLYRDEITALMVTLFVTLSPLVIRYSATAYIDPLMMTLVTISLVITAGYSPEKSNKLNEIDSSSNFKQQLDGAKPGRLDLAPYGVGLAFGLALAAKYQALLYLPLLVGLALINGWRWRHWRRGISSFAAVLVILIWWDYLQDGKLSLVDNQWRSIGGLRIIWSQELTTRLANWTSDWTTILGIPAFLILLFLGTPLFLYGFFREKNRTTAIDTLLLLFTAGYFLLHWLVAIPLWSRYILPIAPIVIILFARLLLQLWLNISRLIQRSRIKKIAEYQLSWLWLFFFLMIGITPALRARNGEIQLSDLHQLDNSIEEIAVYLSDSASAAVLYDHWFSWYWRYILFDSEIYISWFPDFESLSRDLVVFGRDGTERYLALPNDEQAKPIIRAVNDAGFYLDKVTFQSLRENTAITLYKIRAGRGD
jgi:4-amino-4-deoxy-L-arabinose transferase-like glycosyltransferase